MTTTTKKKVIAPSFPDLSELIAEKVADSSLWDIENPIALENEGTAPASPCWSVPYKAAPELTLRINCEVEHRVAGANNWNLTCDLYLGTTRLDMCGVGTSSNDSGSGCITNRLIELAHEVLSHHLDAWDESFEADRSNIYSSVLSLLKT